MESEVLLLGTWELRGKGHILRMVMEYLHIPYEMKSYSSPESFLVEEREMAHMAINLPYIKDGKLLVFDLTPIVTYLTSKHHLQDFMGKTNQHRAFTDMFHWEMQTLLQKLISSTFLKTEEEKKTYRERSFKDTIEPIMQKLQRQTSDEWYLGYLSLNDFCISELLSYLEIIFPGRVCQYPKLIEICKKVQGIPQIAQFNKDANIAQLSFFPESILRNSALR